MRTRRLGKTELELSVVGLGCWAMGGGTWEYSWGPQEDAESVKTIAKALEAGINWVDTAAVYGLGHSEEVVGRAIKEIGERPIVATKCGIRWNSKGKIDRYVSRERVREEIEASLRRLGLEQIDLYQIHHPLPDENVEQAWEEMVRLVEEDKVRYIGVSNFDVGQLRRISRIYPPVSLQPPYSMIRRSVEDEILGYCRMHNIGVIVYSPMQKGLLTGRWSRERLEHLPEADHRRRDFNFQEPRFSATLELVEGLKQIAARSGTTAGRLAIEWVLRREEVTAAIVGARRPYQIEETAPAGDRMLSGDEIAEIEGLLARREQKLAGG